MTGRSAIENFAGAVPPSRLGTLDLPPRPLAKKRGYRRPPGSWPTLLIESGFGPTTRSSSLPALFSELAAGMGLPVLGLERNPSTSPGVWGDRRAIYFSFTNNSNRSDRKRDRKFLKGVSKAFFESFWGKYCQCRRRQMTSPSGWIRPWSTSHCRASAASSSNQAWVEPRRKL